MIIDTTVSTVENQFRVRRVFEEAFAPKSWPSGWSLPRSIREKKARRQYRAAAVRDFLLKRGDIPPEDLSNTMVIWKNGEVAEVQWAPGKEPQTELVPGYNAVAKTNLEAALREFLRLIGFQADLWTIE